MKVTLFVRRVDEEVGEVLAENTKCDEACLRELFEEFREALLTSEERSVTYRQDAGKGMTFSTIEVVEVRLYEDDMVVETLVREELME